MTWPFPLGALRGKMKNILVIVTCKCVACRVLIAEDCVRLGLPVPKKEKCELPSRWVGRICPHLADGLTIESLDGLCESQTNMPEESMRWKQAEELELPAWRNNLDFTKNWGFPC